MGFELTAGALVPIWHNEFAIDNVGVAYEPLAIGVTAGARVVAALGAVRPEPSLPLARPPHDVTAAFL